MAVVMSGSNVPLGKWISDAVNTARKRARKNGWDFDIDSTFLRQTYEKQKGRCAVTKLPFVLLHKEGQLRRPYAPSIDRIDPNKGYVKSNCRIVCVAVNLAMNEWGVGVLRRISGALSRDEVLIDAVRAANEKDVQIHSLERGLHALIQENEKLRTWCVPIDYSEYQLKGYISALERMAHMIAEHSDMVGIRSEVRRLRGLYLARQDVISQNPETCLPERPVNDRGVCGRCEQNAKCAIYKEDIGSPDTTRTCDPVINSHKM